MSLVFVLFKTTVRKHYIENNTLFHILITLFFFHIILFFIFHIITLFIFHILIHISCQTLTHCNTTTQRGLVDWLLRIIDIPNLNNHSHSTSIPEFDHLNNHKSKLVHPIKCNSLYEYGTLSHTHKWITLYFITLDDSLYTFCLQYSRDELSYHFLHKQFEHSRTIHQPIRLLYFDKAHVIDSWFLLYFIL